MTWKMEDELNMGFCTRCITSLKCFEETDEEMCSFNIVMIIVLEL